MLSTARKTRSLEDTACVKNPGHKSYISAKQFSKKHLPADYRSKKVVSLVQCVAGLTVRIKVCYTSENRLPNDSSYSFRGKRVYRFGSGSVVNIQYSSPDNIHCLQTCQESNKEMACIYIMTASHVVFDDSEAGASTVDFFYDDGNAESKSLKGWKVNESSIEKDMCVFACLTNDMELVSKLQRIHAHYTELQRAIGMKETVAKDENVSIESSDSESVQHADSKLKFWKAVGIVNKKPEESEISGIEVAVTYPDHTKEKCLLCQWEETVTEVKKWLFHHANIQERPDDYRMVMELPGDDEQDMDDDENITVYFNSLSHAEGVYFRLKSDGSPICDGK